MRRLNLDLGVRSYKPRLELRATDAFTSAKGKEKQVTVRYSQSTDQYLTIQYTTGTDPPSRNKQQQT
eukprot:5033722-Amphidinium_carterae.1